MRKFSITVLFLLLIYPVYVASSIALYSFESSDEKADAAIVLGAAVWNGQPSPVFEERIRHSITLYHDKQVRTLIFTGGIGDGDIKSEAGVAMEYAIGKGVPRQSILIEDRSKFTIENLTFAAELLPENNIESVLLVSDPLHMKRAMTMADDIGISALPSPTQTSRYKSLTSKMRMLLFETRYLIGYQVITLFR